MVFALFLQEGLEIRQIQKFVAFMMFLLLFKFLKFELLGHFRLIFRANFRFLAY